jgi:predicted lipid-binding transport protein (Tim44 family)
MRKWLLAVSLTFLGGVMAVGDAEARRLGGGRSVGIQRNVTPPAKPAQQQASPKQAPATPGAAQSGGRWGGILGGLAIGGLLGYLFGGSGLLGVLALAFLAVVVFALVGGLVRRSRPQAAGQIQFAGFGDETVAAPPPSQATGSVAPVAPAAIPPGFDAPAFLRSAKMNFIKLQAANDSGRLDEIREFTTNAMFDELRTDIRAGVQETDVVALNADLLELATEKGNHWASVRFSGMVRETPGTEPVGFEEVWNLVKPADGSSGWLLAGIQQMH